ncbi:MAG: hypothetical protein NDI91_06535 [Sulfuritalea sp.]|nr:hypothetical protein [Sulfuritalea sp.]
MAGLLGISAYYHDSAAALVVDGRVVAAAQQERFSRLKFDPGFPADAIRYCLREWGDNLARLDAIVFYDKPIQKFDRLLETHLALAPRGARNFIAAMQAFLQDKLPLKRILREALADASGCSVAELPPLLFCAHHQSHAASAFFPSPFDRAAVLCVDGVGEWATTSLWRGEGRDISPCWELRFPHSLGLLYAAFTQFCGFRVNADEYKLMGLASYGTPRYSDLILSRLVDLKPDGSFRLQLEYFDFAVGLTMVNQRFCALFGGPSRLPGTPITQREKDIACSIQHVTEEILLRLAATAHRELAMTNLCLAGGVALNCVAVGRLRREGPFSRIWVQPAASDAGGAVGAALAAWHQHFGRPRSVSMQGGMGAALLGPVYGDSEVVACLAGLRARYERLDEAELLETVARRLLEGETIGWFEGRMEFGPRALGARSILADPRAAAMRERLNLHVKRRESFRPFAAAVTEERATEHFGVSLPSPYMSFAELVQPPLPGKPALAAVTHVDGSARLQTVSKKYQPRLHQLLERFGAMTGVPVLLNTSFNGPDEPIVNSPAEAFHCFMKLGVDCLVIGDYLLERKAQPDLPTAPAAVSAVAPTLRSRLTAIFARAQTKLILGSIYFLVIVPAGWISRAVGRHPLELGVDPERSSYRVTSDAPTNMRHPF